MSEYRFHVDLLVGNRVEGWAVLIKDPEHRTQVSLFVNGKFKGDTECSKYRLDLEAAGIGDGRYAFSLEVHDIIDPDVDAMHFVLDDKVEYVTTFVNGQFLTTLVSADQSSRSGRANEDAVSDVKKRDLYCDVTDLFFYWTHHRRVSGIQRVQLGYVKYLLENDVPGFRVVFCFKTVPGQTFFTLGANELKKLVDVNYDESYPDSRWQQDLRQMLSKPRVPTKFEEGGILAVLGAPWVSPEYYEIIARLKAGRGTKVIQLIYDVIPLRRPDFCDQQLVGAFSSFAAQSFTIADAFMAISEHTKAEIEEVMREWSLPPKPVKVVPMGTELTLPALEDAKYEVGPRVRKLLKQDYVLFVSTVEARKNHRLLVDLWRALIARLGAENTPKLVWVGRRGWLVEDLFNQMEATRWLDGHIIHLQGLSDHELELLYKGCLFTVFPSFYEGWGLPVTESLCYGKPCVAARNSSIVEAGGDLATYVDLDNSREALETILDLIQDRGRLKAIEDRIVREFSPLSWDAATESLLRSLLDLDAAIPSAAQATVAFADDETSFSPDCVPVFSLGEEISVGTAFDARDGAAVDVASAMKRYMFFGQDWQAVEPWGRWAKGRSARLLFAVRDDGQSDLALYLMLSLPGFFGPTKLSVFVGGRYKGEIPMQATGETEATRVLVSPSELIHIGDRSFIALELVAPHDVATPANLNDARLLGPGMKSLTVCRADDIEARITFLELWAGLKLPKQLGADHLSIS